MYSIYSNLTFKLLFPFIMANKPLHKKLTGSLALRAVFFLLHDHSEKYKHVQDTLYIVVGKAKAVTLNSLSANVPELIDYRDIVYDNEQHTLLCVSLPDGTEQAFKDGKLHQVITEDNYQPFSNTYANTLLQGEEDKLRLRLEQEIRTHFNISDDSKEVRTDTWWNLGVRHLLPKVSSDDEKLWINSEHQ